MAKTAEERFIEKIEVDAATGCWNWTASLFARTGYAQFRYSPQKNGRGHCWAYEHYVGPVPPGLQLDHLCRNKRCVNPGHLEAVTAQENVLRSDNACGLNARKTHCKHGHEFTPENTHVNKAGSRMCRECMRQQGRDWYERNLLHARRYQREYHRARRKRLAGRGPADAASESTT